MMAPRAPSKMHHSALNIALGEIGKQGARLDGRRNSTGAVDVNLEQSTNGFYQDPSATMPGFRYNAFFAILMKIDVVMC
jgi:hypothetical protein